MAWTKHAGVRGVEVVVKVVVEVVVEVKQVSVAWRGRVPRSRAHSKVEVSFS